MRPKAGLAETVLHHAAATQGSFPIATSVENVAPLGALVTSFIKCSLVLDSTYCPANCNYTAFCNLVPAAQTQFE